ncbi:MAG: hypothetical protein R2755_08700 [Acidimicrobiales bacterium]
MGTVAVAPGDDAGALHLRRADQTVTLPGRGAAVPRRRRRGGRL